MKIVLVVAALLASMPAFAQEKIDNPKPKEQGQPVEFKYDRPANRAFWVGSAAMGASSLGPWVGGNICRSNNGVEPCTEHYGSYNAWNALLSGASVFAAPALFYGCRKENRNARWCWFIPAAVIGGNLGWGVHEALIDKPERDRRPEAKRR